MEFGVASQPLLVRKFMIKVKGSASKKSLDLKRTLRRKSLPLAFKLNQKK